MCQDGARAVHNQAISRIKSDGLKVFVVWTPRYPGDNRAKAVAATSIVPDSRATHYWDADGTMSKQYGQILDLPEDKQFAWDTYMLFDSKADWTQSPPNPTEWMHQMSQVFGRNHPRWLNGERFRQAVESKID